jgi:RNA polymerase sigma-70 factor (ECF subfamily)
MKTSISCETESAFNHLWRTHHPMVVRLARYYGRDPDEAGDLTQEIAYQLWRSFDSFKGDAKLSTWVYRVALNTCLSFHRKYKPVRVAWKDAPPEQVFTRPEEQMDQRALLEGIQAFAKGFKPVDQTLFLLLMEGLSYDEMAAITGLSENNVGVRINRIRKRIKEQFS